MKNKVIYLILTGALILSGCSSSEKASSTLPDISQPELVGDIYHGDEYFIIDEYATTLSKDGCAYDSEKRIWNTPFAVMREIENTFYCDSLTSPDEFETDIKYKGKLPENKSARFCALSVGDIVGSGLTVTSVHSSIKEKLIYDRESNTTKPDISAVMSSDITLSGETTLEGVIYVVLGEDLYIAEENAVLFFPYPESLKNALGFSPKLSGRISETFLTSNFSKTNALLCGDCVYFYVGNLDSCKWLTKDFGSKPFGTAKLTISDMSLSWQDDGMDRFYATVIDAKDVKSIR